MSENNIQSFYVISGILSLALTWLKTGVWWYGIIFGWIILPILGGLLNAFLIRPIVDKIKGYPTGNYPGLVYSFIIIMIIFLTW